MLRGTRHQGGAAANLGVCILAGCVLIAVSNWAVGDSSPRRAYRGTHLGVAPDDMVTLRSSGTGATLKFYRVGTDGSTDASEYSVPSGTKLVVTDVEAYVNSGGAPSMIRIYIENKTTPSTRSIVSFPGTEAYGSNSGYMKFSSTAGFVVSPAARIIADAPSSLTWSFPYTSNAPTLILHGYVVPDA